MCKTFMWSTYGIHVIVQSVFSNSRKSVQSNTENKNIIEVEELVKKLLVILNE